MIRPMPSSRKSTTMGPLSPSGSTNSHSPTTPKLPGSAQTVISVEEWEAKAPLGALELKSVAVIQAAAERKPLPLKVQVITTHPPYQMLTYTRSLVLEMKMPVLRVPIPPLHLVPRSLAHGHFWASGHLALARHPGSDLVGRHIHSYHRSQCRPLRLSMTGRLSSIGP
jgi:hypothetical protein